MTNEKDDPPCANCGYPADDHMQVDQELPDEGMRLRGCEESECEQYENPND